MLNNEMVEIISHINQYVPFKTVNSQVDVSSTGELLTLTKIRMEKLFLLVLQQEPGGPRKQEQILLQQKSVSMV